MKKILPIIALILITFTGCSYAQTGIEQLLTPPMLSKEQTSIYSALESKKGKNIKLKYPKNGDNTSAYLLYNLDEEETNEAIVFYENLNTAINTFTINIGVFDQQNGTWILTYTTPIEASEVYKVSFTKTNNKTYIVIGFNQLSNNEKVIKVYNYTTGKLNEISSIKCNNYEVFDLDGDDVSDIITMSSKSTTTLNKVTNAIAYKISDNGVIAVSETLLDPSVTEYANIYGGKIKSGIPALYVDGIKETTNMITEILTLQNKQLENLVYSPSEELNLVPKTMRISGSHCLDIGNDNIYEIPNVKPALGYESSEKNNMVAITDWYYYDNSDFKLRSSSYVDYKLGYIFEFPDKWKDVVTIQKNAQENEILFYVSNQGYFSSDNILLSIKVLQSNNILSKLGSEDYRVLSDNGQLQYLYKLYDIDNYLSLSEEELRHLFKLL